jgi:PAS domain S-box-containing protein
MDLRGLLSTDFSVTACDSIESARAALAGRPHALVVLDLHLQDGNWFELLRTIRAINAEQRPKVIVLSEDATTASRRRAIRAGADIYVSKPYDGAYVLARVCELVHANDKESGAAARERSPSLANSLANSLAKKILVIDTGAAHPNTLADVLRQDHHDVVLASTSEEALELLELEAVDAMILDLDMPGMGGIETCRRARHIPGRKQMPIMMLTGSVDETVRRECIRAGADELVVKSPEPDLLKVRLRALLHRKRDERDLRAADRTVQGSNGPWRAQDDVPPGSLLFRAIVETGVSSIIGPRTMVRVCSHAGIDPRTSSAADVERALPALREALGIFLPPEQVEQRIAAVSAFARETAAIVKGPSAAEERGAAQAKKRAPKPIVKKPASVEKPMSVVSPAVAAEVSTRESMPREVERLQHLFSEEHAAKSRTGAAVAELTALRLATFPHKIAPSIPIDDNAERKAATGTNNEWGYRSLADALPCAICAAKPNGSIDYVNQRLADFLGIPLSQVLTARASNFIHPRDLAATLKAWRSAVASSAPCSVEMRVLRYDGAYRWMLVQASPVRTSSGAVLRWFGAATDIDDLKRTQAQTEAMLEAASIGVAFCDADLRYLRVNEAFAALDNVSPEAHVGRRVDEVVPAMTDAVVPLAKRALATGEPVKNVEVSGAPGGAKCWLASYYPVKVDERVAGVMIIAVDITAQKRRKISDAVLARASASLSASLDTDMTLHNLARVVVPDLADLCIVFLKDEHGAVRVATVVHADPTKLELIRTLSERYPSPADAPHGYQYVLRTGKSDIIPVMTDEILASVASNEEHLRLLRELKSTSGVIVPLPASGRIIGAMMLLSWESGHRFVPSDVPIAEDIGRYLAVALEHAEDFQAAKHDKSRAEEASRLKDEFLAMVSHELRTPLSAVLGWTRMLRTGKVDPGRTEKALAMIERNTLAQAQLIEDLLDVGRIVAGNLRLSICPANLPQIIEAAVESMRPVAETRGVLLETEIDLEASPVMGDAGRLQQIAFNLINNAVKFTPREGRVKVILRRPDRFVELVVEDTGRGISADFLPHIFERFRQAESRGHRSKGGLGLGLAIVKRLVELHGGTIEAKSEGEGRGTSVTMKLPIAPLRITQDEVDPGARPSWPPSESISFGCPAALDGLSILVVDDEPDAVHILRALLEQSKARVLTATSAAEAMKIVDESRPDIVVADIGMPGEDGHAFLRRLRALPEERGGLIPAVALTAFGGEKDRERSRQSGFDQHLPKPVEPSELVQTLASLKSRAQP